MKKMAFGVQNLWNAARYDQDCY